MIPNFRAWDKTTSKLHVVNGIYCDNKKIHYIDDNRVRFVGFDNVIIMQSTAMVDRDGRIIFEGDIVKMAKDVYSEPTYYEVVRHHGGAYRLESKQHGCELWLRHTDCEVVGNVYENPELLEDE